jgi:hypothetical protein
MTDARVAPDTAQYFSRRKGLLVLWVGILLPPFAWFLHQQLSYMLVPWACSTGRQFILYGVTLAMLLLAIGSGLTARQSWRRLGRDEPHEAGEVVARSRFMAIVGMLSGVMFSLVILARGIPSFILNACEP